MQQKLFLGFTPTSAQKEYLITLQQTLCTSLPPEAKPVGAHNLHLTLAFLGLVDERQKINLIDAVNNLVKPTFSINLNGFDLWPNAQVCCLRGYAIVPSLAQLARQTQLIAERLQLYKSEHTFCPHISLFRKAKGWRQANNPPDLAMFKNIDKSGLTLRPDSLHLYHSTNTTTGVEYQTQHTWTLT
ncbi:RNA 2',3'-cyclic phosphodiesterase [Shewanella glacialipiscicola]|uniref:RNA 2',3'-cyclic phosphodiesterase n=1 Tax=Shewanella glacialipiscicola TaxID=614069 RepID=UPI003D7B7A4A